MPVSALPALSPRAADAPPTARIGRNAAILLALVLVLVIVMLASIALGSRAVPLGEVWHAFTNMDPTNNDHLVVRDQRVPRTLIGLMVGVSLGVGGAVMQGLTRNPLADPGLLGVDGGASLCVVVGIGYLGAVAAGQYVWFALFGTAVASLAVYAIGASGREGVTPVKLALAGAALSAAFTSVVTALLLLDPKTFDNYRFWVVGSLSGRDMSTLLAVLPFLVVGLILALAMGRFLNALALGDDVARGLGQRVGAARGLGAVVIVLLCGGATAVAGPISFVGLTVPHVARIFVGADHRWILPYSAVLGAILILGADTIGRLIARPGEIEVGIITALVGAPVFIFLVRRSRMAQL
ncbi:iron chelate uptake ABC transporter family permease subunit [Williamsia sp. 1135]|uniref:FecCD family ABC transporter permease n=1 Tax=Williamsia sp. 1135 TaxID=1889262 RepID=UPI000A105863|nr:iron chelate uptake ABC transporter family permease subunit [Williamsia sp. 1135]ORM31835.1 iron ABC transporter permease [Williamsia sp. 1135]